MKIRLGSRGSALALAQVELFKSAYLAAFPDDELHFEIVKTTGDKKQETPAASISDKREWIHELEQAVVAGELDGALHCGKDVPCDLAPGTELVPVLKRATPYDIFIGRKGEDGSRLRFRDLKPASKIGTASLRRRAQLLRLNSGLELVELRGNVTTRVRKLDGGEADGIILAKAGVERLGELEVEGEEMSAQQMLPAVNQGMLCIQMRESEELRERFASLVSVEDKASFTAERRVAEVLEGDCHSAIGIFALVDGQQLTIRSEVYAHDGSKALSSERTGDVSSASTLGEEVAGELLSKGAKELL